MNGRLRTGRPGLIGMLMIVLIIGFTSPQKAAAYNVCTDDGSPCTHETMTEQALDLFENQFPTSNIAQEMRTYWSDMKKGVGNPDQFDPLYDNDGFGDALITITHFWSPDTDIDYPMDGFGLDEYPNAFGSAQALWVRALGEYADGNKKGAYQLLGMVAHFLGDQTIPTHAHNDVHGPDFIQSDAYEEWMSQTQTGTPSPNAILSSSEVSDLQELGLFNPPWEQTEDNFLWIFLRTNQVADYFASDDTDGDANHPSDPFVLPAEDWAQDALDEVIAACAADPDPCPLTIASLENNSIDGLVGWVNFDGDLDRIRKYSYLPGIRSMATLFALWEEAVRTPILTLTVHNIKEIGDYEGDCGVLEACAGLDDLLKPDFFVGMVMGQNRATCGNGGAACSAPPGSYLYDSDGDRREIDNAPYPANVTRYDAFFWDPTIPWNSFDEERHGTEDENSVSPDYQFGQSYTTRTSYQAGEDIVDLTLFVWDQDTNNAFLAPYASDDIGDISPGAGRDLNITVDLAKCRQGANDAIRVEGSSYACSETTDGEVRISKQGDDDDSDEVRVTFSITAYLGPTPPTVSASLLTADPKEGQLLSFSAVGDDPNGDALTYAWDFGDGATGSGPAVTHTFADNGEQTVTVVATDPGGLTGEGTFNFTTANVAPTAIFANTAGGDIVQGQSIIMAFSDQFDPSTADSAAGFSYSYDCDNDGVFEAIDIAAAEFSCLYLASGDFTALGRIKDKDGGFTDYTATATVLPQARFLVTKSFSDGNASEVEVTLTCNNGLPLVQSFMISEGNPVTFILSSFTPGVANCEITETIAVDGYAVNYDNGITISQTSCEYTDVGVVSGDYSCTITNAAENGMFTVNMEWVIDGMGGIEVDQVAAVTIWCDAATIPGTFDDQSGNWFFTTSLENGQSATVMVDTTTGPATCWATQDVSDVSGVEPSGDCGPQTVGAAAEASCTFTNAVIFEGIPSMNRYGLALLVLLMMGVGMVGFRRLT